MPTLRSDVIEVTIHPQTLTVTVRDLRSGTEWAMQEAGPGDIGIKGHAGPWEGLPFRTASKIAWEGNAQVQRARLSHWPVRANVWSALDFVVEVEFRVDGADLEITLSTINGRGEASFIDSFYPRGFLLPAQGDLVLPYGQGCLLRKDFPCALDHTLPTYAGAGFVMPWWGQLTDDGAGLLAVTDTPDDLGIRLVTDAEGGQTAHPYWQASLGNFRYPRTIRYTFYDHANVVTLAKGYRRHAEARGQAVTLAEKAAARPNVARLRGGMVINIWHESYFQKQDRRYLLGFEEGLEELLYILREVEVKKAIVHVDGWGTDGYDFNHPDLLPPDELLGGWDGLTKMADTVQAMGHMFLLHDNYVDIYAHTPSFSSERTVLDLSHIRPENCEWLGGRQQWLCPQRTMPVFRRNMEEIRRHFNPSGAYLDCFTVSHLRECYDQEHPCSRGDARQAWSEIFALCHEYGWATSSEGGADWAIPVLDFCWSVQPALCPTDLRETLGGKPLGDPIPLYNLVWHDCLVVPMFITEKGNIDDALWVTLWGGIPSVRPESFHPRGMELTKKALGKREVVEFVRSLQPIVDLSARVGFDELVNLELLDADRKVQRTTFADGTQVTVDFIRKEYQIALPEQGNGKVRTFALTGVSS